MMNILEEEDKHTEDLRKCKILFLKNENQWMAKQKEFINVLIHKYKMIIQFSEQPQNEHQILDQHNEINRIVQQKIQQYHNLKNTQFFWEQEMNNEEFLDIIQSFQTKILKLQQAIKHRENQLQEIQERKIKEDDCRFRKNQSKWLNNIQTNRKLIQKVRSQVALLKQKKKKIQNKIVAASQNSVYSHNNITPIKTRRQNSITKENEMSTFQKALLVFKKKKYQNQVLQQKIKQLQNKIAFKKMISQKIKKEAENMEWKCLQGLYGGVNGQIDSNYDYEFSVMDKSVCLQSMSFSFDISRFIKPRQIVGPF